MIEGVGEEVKGYRVYLPKVKKVVTSQHVRNIETLSKTQNLQVQKLYRDEDESEPEEESGERDSGAVDQSSTGKESDTKGCVARTAGAEMTEAAQQNTTSGNVVSSVLERDPRNYKETMRSRQKIAWLKAIGEELKALESNGVWEVVRLPKNVRVLHTKWVFKTKLDAEGLIERLKARLVACGNEQTFGVNYSVTFAAVDKRKADTGTCQKVARARQAWRRAERLCEGGQGGRLADLHTRVASTRIEEGSLRVETSRLWSKLLHSKLVELGFDQSLVGMCVYYRYKAGVLIVVGVYVDDLLVTGTQQEAVDVFFEELKSLEIKDLGCAHKFLDMRIEYSDDYGYDLDQEVTIDELL
ncbi:hypothetical protein PF005_g5220 [Phytophthora fragariae]|uniref:Reverse transcriptase Ty1/copia-type domain-containing protein n=1 Tax=Phytophthora fragariae TaxID=53985 RepID=A0A6A3ZZV6_9STRA|nr:hypothetical protein PF011_g4169 [Phytophthora fragariae]KAE9226173.1 hypothetical protein PF005_g5220 [Phytophthora fragariae]KAE9248282.1 hypothetical protein PF002_g5855 [Phytophthora fragariae]